MNKRIRELANEAAKYSATMFLPTGENGDDLFVKKFAQLIVRECAGLCSTHETADEPFGEKSYRKGRHFDVMIRQHFGVEESVNVETKHKCSICGTTENVSWVGGHQPYLCDSPDCIPF